MFEFFDDIEREARLGEISQRLQLPLSSLSVLLHSLVKLGYLSHDPERKTFVPTLRIGMLGAWTGGSLAHHGWITRILEDLSEQTGETITVAARNGIYAQYIRVIQSSHALRVHVPTGTYRLLVWSASGTALLSNTEESEIEALVRRTNAENPNMKKWIELEQVLQNIEAFRRQGYFFSQELVTTGGGHIAMRLPNTGIGSEGQIYALGVAGWIDRMQEKEECIIGLMRETLRSRFEPQ